MCSKNHRTGNAGHARFIVMLCALVSLVPLVAGCDPITLLTLSSTQQRGRGFTRPNPYEAKEEERAVTAAARAQEAFARGDWRRGADEAASALTSRYSVNLPRKTTTALFTSLQNLPEPEKVAFHQRACARGRELHAVVDKLERGGSRDLPSSPTRVFDKREELINLMHLTRGLNPVGARDTTDPRLLTGYYPSFDGAFESWQASCTSAPVHSSTATAVHGAAAIGGTGRRPPAAVQPPAPDPSDPMSGLERTPR